MSRWRTAVGAGVVPAVVLTLALVHPGASVAQVDLNDGTVWLTNAAQLKLGRYNPAVDELNAGLVAGSADLDVRQDGTDVLLVEPGRIGVVDPAAVALAAQVTVPADAEVGLGAGVVAVADPQGAVWIRTLAELASLDPATAVPDLDLGPGGRAVVSRTGTTLAVEPDGDLWRVPAGTPEPEPAGELAGTGRPGAATAVGETLVVLSGSTVRTAAGTTSLARWGTDLTLQQPGPAADVVLVATPQALLAVPLAGGDVVETPSGGSGAPAAPVRVGACVHGAWATASGSYLRLCPGTEPVREDLEDLTAADRLVFRVNRDVVVLNDTARGRLWVPLEDTARREPNWADIQPEAETQQDERRTENLRATENLLAECTAEATAPTAVDDQHGVRAGRSTVLSVIDNDGASDCGVLTVSEFDQVPPELGTLVRVHGGRALQLTTRPGATGTYTFTYTISDGRGTAAPSTATVRVTVVDAATDNPPAQLRTGALLVEQGATTTYDVLADFLDPDGDELVLVGAAATGAGAARARWDGVLTFQADAGALGRQAVVVQVSDGTSTVEGTVWADVRPAGSLAPVVGPVQAGTEVDTPVDVAPLDEVRNPSREELRLARVDDVPGVTVTGDLTAGTFRFTAATPGTYYVPFLVTAGQQQAAGLARIDVTAAPEEPLPPVTVRDAAVLPPGGEVTVAPLANDVDPAGGVLVLQSTLIPEGSGVRAAVVDHEMVRIDATRTLTEPVVITYTVSNGTGTADGEILVQPAPPTAGQQAPVIPGSTATVRAGGVVTIPVLEHAYDPDGDTITLDRELAEPLGPGEGLLFVSGDVLRYQAPATPMTVHATFNVVDEAGNETAGTVTVTVRDSDAATKAPPTPRDLTARVFDGDTVRIPVPLTGIDLDGDGVYLLGIATAPRKGLVTATGPDWLEYRALPGEAGPDTFTYAVEDWVGQRSVATVRVGIAARPTTTAQVVARADEVTVRPDRTVEVRVLANDIDTSGGTLTLDSLDLGAAQLPDGVTPVITGRRITVTTPPEATVLQIPYIVVNDRGGRDTSVLTVVVDPEAPYRAPVAADVVVPATETVNRTEVEVGVLDVAANPSGSVADLAVSVHPSVADVATVTPEGTVTVRLVDRPQTLPYLLTNTDPEAGGISSYAFISVPGLGDFPPILRPNEEPPVVVAGERIEIDVEQYVQVGPGKTPAVVDASTVTATRSDGSELIRDATTLLYRARRDYAGPASISFEVVDGPVGEPGTYRRVLTLPITVLAGEAYPPTFTPSVLDVAAGDQVRVDLSAFTSRVGTAAGEPTYRYTIVHPPGGGVSAALDGSVLTLAARATVPRGTVGGVGLSIEYGGATPLPVRVDFRVLASGRQLARVVDHTVPDGVEGTSTFVDVLAGAFNPFAPEPLTVTGVAVETPGSGTATVAGSQVGVRPDPGFIGQMVVRYRVGDVTGDPQREVDGRITLVVRGRPAQPATPRVTEVRDRTVVLSWDAPANNGEPITGYRVTAQPGGQVRECASTTCTIDGLTNDVEYTFTVAARNAVDWSLPSLPSAKVRPDAVPTAPGTPTLGFGDGRLEAAWAPAASTGSPITSYTVEVSPRPAVGPASFEVTGTSTVITGLENGTSYGVRVRANNRAPEPGPWSEYAREVPARAPDAPVVTARRVDTPLGGVVELEWTEQGSGGDPIRGYRVAFTGGPGVLDHPGGTTARLTGARNGATYTFEVRAHNKAGEGVPGIATATPFRVPDAVTGLTATASGTGAPYEGSVALTWTPAADGGSVVTGYEVENALGRVWPTPGTTLSVTGLTGGVEQVFRVRALNVAGAGAWSTSVTATPRTRPSAPTAVTLGTPVTDATGKPMSIAATWSAPASWGGGANPVYQSRLMADGVQVRPWSATTTQTQATYQIGDLFDPLWSRELTVEVRAGTSVGFSETAASPRLRIEVGEAGPVTALTPVLASDRATVTVTWGAPTPTGAPPPTGYVLEHRERPAEDWETTEVADPAQRTVTFDVSAGLQENGGTVDIRVWAVNVRGDGPATTVALAVGPPAPPPGAPEPALPGATRHRLADAFAAWGLTFRTTQESPSR